VKGVPCPRRLARRIDIGRGRNEGSWTTVEPGRADGGVRAELTYPPTGDDAADYREDAKEEALPGTCQEKPVDEIITALVPSREAGIPAVVEVSHKECSAGEVPMIQADGKWYVDETEVEGSLICT